ncbi:hypothetical protein DPMN_038056 [Dreissena polymorpha]|uniref:Uncharacterized protein n=1 Tax=Dreissena polymorpha TaxID=45954 RepID=A0A9D4MDM1_DREPO|nr:hypothetical protein DPMN_038056 [Dreissena polymorpha]
MELYVHTCASRPAYRLTHPLGSRALCERRPILYNRCERAPSYVQLVAARLRLKEHVNVLCIEGMEQLSY